MASRGKGRVSGVRKAPDGIAAQRGRGRARGFRPAFSLCEAMCSVCARTCSECVHDMAECVHFARQCVQFACRRVQSTGARGGKASAHGEIVSTRADRRRVHWWRAPQQGQDRLRRRAVRGSTGSPRTGWVGSWDRRQAATGTDVTRAAPRLLNGHGPARLGYGWDWLARAGGANPGAL